jgi:CRP-like cAMP-binding protein
MDDLRATSGPVIRPSSNDGKRTSSRVAAANGVYRTDRRIAPVLPSGVVPVNEQSLHANRILALLPPAERDQLLGHASEIVRLRRGTVLQEPGHERLGVFFPLNGVLSLMTVLSDGSGVEAAVAGSEGMAGFPLFGDGPAAHRVLVQVSGQALRVTPAQFRQALERHGRLATLATQYLELTLLQAAQTSACNRRHSVIQRYARTLLSWHDRTDGGPFRITHDALAQAIGARRSGVTEAAGALSRDGVIRGGRGLFVIEDRARMEQCACECYGVIREAFTREERAAAAWRNDGANGG